MNNLPKCCPVCNTRGKQFKVLETLDSFRAICSRCGYKHEPLINSSMSNFEEFQNAG